MTEDRWVTESGHPQGMPWHLRSVGWARTKAGRRKLRLFACECCRLIWDLLTDPRSREAVEVAERFAEGNATKEELEGAFEKAEHLSVGSFDPEVPGASERTAAFLACNTCATPASSAAVYPTATPLPLAGYQLGERDGNAVLCDLLRCVFGNPFRPAKLPREWRTPTIRGVARQIHDDRRFGELSILADALEDAGCDHPDLLEHSRGPGPHARGCWLLDLALRRGRGSS